MKRVIDFDKIAEGHFSEGQIAGFMRENKWTREYTLLYLWFYNIVWCMINIIIYYSAGYGIDIIILYFIVWV